MAWRLSTGLRNALLQAPHRVVQIARGTTFSFSEGTGVDGSDRILDSADGFGTFVVGDYMTTYGSASNNEKRGIIVAVAAGYIDVYGAALVTEAAGPDVEVATATGGSFAGIFRKGVIRIFTGPQPATANDAETGTQLCQITLNSGAFTPGALTNGLSFGQVADGVLSKAAGEVWSGQNIATGTAGWFRIYDNTRTTGTSTSANRIDGACSTSGGQLNLTTTNLTNGVTTTLDTVQITMPAA